MWFCHYLVRVNKASFLQQQCFPTGYHHLCSALWVTVGRAISSFLNSSESFDCCGLNLSSHLHLFVGGEGDFPASHLNPFHICTLQPEEFPRWGKRATEHLNVSTDEVEHDAVFTYWGMSHPLWCNLFGIWLDVHLPQKQAPFANETFFF